MVLNVVDRLEFIGPYTDPFVILFLPVKTLLSGEV